MRASYFHESEIDGVFAWAECLGRGENKRQRGVRRVRMRFDFLGDVPNTEEYPINLPLRFCNNWETWAGAFGVDANGNTVSTGPVAWLVEYISYTVIAVCTWHCQSYRYILTVC